MIPLSNHGIINCKSWRSPWKPFTSSAQRAQRLFQHLQRAAHSPTPPTSPYAKHFAELKSHSLLFLFYCVCLKIWLIEISFLP